MKNRRFVPASAFRLAFAGLIALGVSGCVINADENDKDDLPPVSPVGVRSITGDGQVIVVWIENRDHDLAGYEIWRSDRADSGFRKLATVGPRVTEYLDTDVRNGETYFYAVLAFDFDGNESELSRETVEDTPRPEGRGVTLTNYRIRPATAGFTFTAPEIGPRNWDRNGDDLLDRDVDVFFGVDEEIAVRFLYSDHDDLFMQDLGYHDRMDAVDVAPTKGYTTISVELIEGHVYAFFTPDGRYAKIRVTAVTPEFVTFDWATQMQRENPDLAPSKNPASVTRGRERQKR